MPDSLSPPSIGHNSVISAYAPFLTIIEEWEVKNAEVSFDYEEPDGNKEARSHIHKIRGIKGDVERARKAEKAESLKYGKAVDAQAKELASRIEAMIEVHETPIREIENREKNRIAKHEENINEIKDGGDYTSEAWQEIPLQAMKDRLKEISDTPRGAEYWEEFDALALAAIEQAETKIRDAISKRETYEVEQEELKRLRKQEEDRLRAEHEERIRAQAADQAKREAEETAKKRELELKLAAEKAEREKSEAETRAALAEKTAQEKAQREAVEAAAQEAADAARREANTRHRTAVNNAAVDAFVRGGLSSEDAKTAVTLIAKNSVPKISISY